MGQLVYYFPPLQTKVGQAKKSARDLCEYYTRWFEKMQVLGERCRNTLDRPLREAL